MSNACPGRVPYLTIRPRPLLINRCELSDIWNWLKLLKTHNLFLWRHNDQLKQWSHSLIVSRPWSSLSVWYLGTYRAQVGRDTHTGKRFIQMRQRNVSHWYTGRNWVLDIVLRIDIPEPSVSIASEVILSTRENLILGTKITTQTHTSTDIWPIGYSLTSPAI